jgi:WD40 repeat protein
VLTLAERCAARCLAATSDLEGFVRIWDLATGASVVLRARMGAVDTLSFSPDGRWLASSGGSGVQLWDLLALPVGRGEGLASLQARTSTIIDDRRGLVTP